MVIKLCYLYQHKRINYSKYQNRWDGGYDISMLLKDLVVIDLNTLKPIRDISTKTDAEEKIN